MKKSAILVTAAAALIGISVAASPSNAQNALVGGGGASQGRGAGIGTGGFRGGGGGRGGSFAGAPAVQGGAGSFRGSGRRGGSAGRGGGGGWRGAGPGPRPGPGPRYYGGPRHRRGGGPGFALGAAALGLAAGAILGAPAYVDEPPVYADDCMQQVWVRGAWRWRNVCD